MHARTGEKANCTATGSWLKELGLEPHLRGPAAPTRGDTSLVGFDGEHQINGSAAWHRWRATHEFQASPGDCGQTVASHGRPRGSRARSSPCRAGSCVGDADGRDPVPSSEETRGGRRHERPSMARVAAVPSRWPACSALPTASATSATRSGELDGARRSNQPRTGEKGNRAATVSSLKELGLESRCMGLAAPTRRGTSLLGFDGEHQIDGSAAWNRWRTRMWCRGGAEQREESPELAGICPSWRRRRQRRSGEVCVMGGENGVRR